MPLERTLTPVKIEIIAAALCCLVGAACSGSDTSHVVPKGADPSKDQNSAASPASEAPGESTGYAVITGHPGNAPPISNLPNP